MRDGLVRDDSSTTTTSLRRSSSNSLLLFALSLSIAIAVPHLGRAQADQFERPFRASATFYQFVHNRPMHLWTSALAQRDPPEPIHGHNRAEEYRVSPTPDFIVPLERPETTRWSFPLVHSHSPAPSLDHFAQIEDEKGGGGGRIQLEEELREAIEPAVGQWRLYSRCSGGYLQSFGHLVNSRGGPQHQCLINFLIHPHPRDGSILLEQRHAQRFICLNRRGRIVARRLKSHTADMRCRFLEHMTTSGYTLVESVWQPGSFLTSNHKGRLSVKEASHPHYHHRRHHKCLQFAKLSSSLSTTGPMVEGCGVSDEGESAGTVPRRGETGPETPDQSLMHDIAKTVLLSRVEV